MLFYCNTNATQGLAIEAALDIAALRCVSAPRCMEMLAVGGKCPPLAGSLINLVPDQFPSRQGGLLAVRPAVQLAVLKCPDVFAAIGTGESALAVCPRNRILWALGQATLGKRKRRHRDDASRPAI